MPSTFSLETERKCFACLLVGKETESSNAEGMVARGKVTGLLLWQQIRWVTFHARIMDRTALPSKVKGENQLGAQWQETSFAQGWI